MKILVTDDAAFMRMMLKDILINNGHTVIEASNGKEAITKFKEEKPDLITMDITMPEMDGIHALKEIIKIDNTAKVIMCSAMGQQAMVVESIQSGAKDFIVKPFKQDKVLESITKFM